MAILRYHLPFAEDDMLAITVDFLQRAHDLNLEFSPRDGIHILQYALKRLAQDSEHPLSKDRAWAEALERVLGEEATDLDHLAEQRQRALGGEIPGLSLGDFFFDTDDPLNPDQNE
jgi:hypothetical protein